MRGSWAGAMGLTQFMPSSFLVYAVDFEGHGRRDIWTSEADAIGSTANFLASNGWRAGLPWGFEVSCPPASRSRTRFVAAVSVRRLRRPRGSARRRLPLPATGEGRLLFPAGLKGPIFLITSNFEVIKTYNPSTSYALAVALLGDAVTGGGGLVADGRRRTRRSAKVRFAGCRSD